jgi:hypothetical protein
MSFRVIDIFLPHHVFFFSEAGGGEPGAPIASRSHTHPSDGPFTLSNLSDLNLVSVFRCSSPPRNPVYVRRVDPLSLAFSLSLHRHSYISILGEEE